MKKAKQIIVLISTWVAGIVLAPAVFAEEAEPFELDFSNVVEIQIFSLKGYGQFLPNGGARIDRFPSRDELGEVAIAPAGSFSFEEIYALVAPHLNPESVPTSKEYLTIRFLLTPSVDDKYPRVSSRIENEQVIQTLMDGLKEKTVPLHKTFLEELHSKYPPVPGETPVSFRYDSKTNISKWIYGGILAALCVGAVLWLIRKKE